MFERYAVYYTPDGALAEKGAAWLGWDISQGNRVAQPIAHGLDLTALTDAPRRYGLHGTIKPPFFLAQDTSFDGLKNNLADLCCDLKPVKLDALSVNSLAGFLALTPTSDQGALAILAATVVKRLDRFRAPPSDAELARRRSRNLNPRQAENLLEWGYPYVMDEFQFHITLTGRLGDEINSTLKIAQDYFAPVLPSPFYFTSLTLAGQDGDGMFHEINRYPLTG